MYELKRNKLIDLSVKCGGAEYPVTIDIGKQGGDFNGRYAALVDAEIGLKKTMADLNAGSATAEQLEQAQSVYGTAVVAVMELLFGKPNARKILDYFENDYADLLIAIIPFVRDEVAPALRKVKNERLEAYTKATKRPGLFGHR